MEVFMFFSKLSETILFINDIDSKIAALILSGLEQV